MRVIAALVAVGLALTAGQAQAKPPMWVAHGPQATVVMFGSIHILPGKLDWEPEALKAALKDADELWFETPINPAGMLDAAREALARGMLPEKQSLLALLPDDAARAKLEAVAQELNLPMAQLDRLRPWLAEVTIGQAAYAREGATADQGVERKLADAAPQAERHAFETMQQQIAMIADGPVSDQVASLMDSLDEIKDDPDAYRRLMSDWMRADLKALDKDGVEPMRRASPALFKRMLTDRNARWRITLLKRLQGKGKVVVIVGVGHLIGPAGVPQLLRDSGIRVDGPRP